MSEIKNTQEPGQKPESLIDDGPPGNTEQRIAERFAAARRNAQALDGYPGKMPATLDHAYRIQDRAIHLVSHLAGERLGGWKVGKIPVALEDQWGIDRVAGPIFASTIRRVSADSVVEMPIFVGGFAAVEAEFVAVIGSDAPPDQHTWTPKEALKMVADLCIGVEIASSPLSTINELGPAVVVSDFGNNHGLVLGPSISNWRSRAPESMSCRTQVDGQLVGEGGAFTLAGGFVRSVQFSLELMARRGHPLRAGDVIATGQTNGIHNVMVGQTSVTDFGEDGTVGVRLIAATPRSGPTA